MAERTVVCGFCGKSFQVAEDTTKAFCVHCGAETQIGEKTLQEKLDEILDPKKRYNTLLDYLEKNPDDQDAALLEEMFGLRYFHRKNNTFDGFLRLWFDMVTYARKREKPKELLNVQNEIKDFMADEKLMAVRSKSQQAEDLFWHEMQNAIELYYISSKDDRQYTSSFFNLFKMKGDAITAKAAKDVVTTGVALLSLCEQTDDVIKLGEVGRAAFLKAYPNGLAAYNQALNEWKGSEEGKRAVANGIVEPLPEAQEAE